LAVGLRVAVSSASPSPRTPLRHELNVTQYCLHVPYLSDVLLLQSIRCDRARPQSQASKPIPVAFLDHFSLSTFEPMAAPVSRTPSSPAIVPSHPGHHSSSSSSSTTGGGAGASAVASPFGGTVGTAGRGTVSAYAHPDALKRAHPGAVACVAIVGKAVSGSVCFGQGQAGQRQAGRAFFFFFLFFSGFPLVSQTCSTGPHVWARPCP
jgi:hypothetical protein